MDVFTLDPAWGLLFVLGLRHGIDPDHVAVVDNLTFLAVDKRPRLAPWCGTLFAIGHSLSVTVVAVIMALLADIFALPSWAPDVIDWLVIGLLTFVGLANLHALFQPSEYRPIGWRHHLMPQALRTTCHPLAILGIGFVFGLVFDTATQAAAWGAAAASGGGIASALAITTIFAAGMALTDTIDSQIVARLLGTQDRPEIVQRYRRGIGWLIATLSLGMAGYALAEVMGFRIALADRMFALLGAVMMFAVIGLLAVLRLSMRGRKSSPAGCVLRQ